MMPSWTWAVLGCAVAAFGQDGPLADRVRYDIICDAGSTGTRMYLFTSTFIDDDGMEKLKVSTEVIGKRKPGLSAYVGQPDAAVPPLMTLFTKVRDRIPQEYWATTTVTVLGTAGMRTVEQARRQPIYDAIREGLTSSADYVFSKGQLLHLRTLTGTEEGTYSLLCVNFLTGRLNHHLSITQKGEEEQLLGILDLGGSSTQIAVPPLDAHALTPSFDADIEGHSTVRSYAAYGMEQMRERIDKHAIGGGMAASPCYFKGYTEPSNSLSGAGDAEKCRAMLLQVLADSRKKCDADDNECLPGSDGTTAAANQQFFAVSGYLFVTDFASHWLIRSGHTSKLRTHIATMLKKGGNKPTIDELEQAADELCLSDWGEIERATAGGADAGAHRYTDASKAPHRCLEVNYVVTLLRHSYKFPGDKRFVTFEDEVDGNSVEWPLGALLHMRHQADTHSHEHPDEEL